MSTQDSTKTTQELFLGVTGAIGGFAIALMAFDHFVVEGLDDRERASMVKVLKVGVAGAAVMAAASYSGIDPMWWNLDAALAAGDAWLNGGAKKAGSR